MIVPLPPDPTLSIIEKRAFRSKAQWRWAMATGQSFAHDWAHDTPGGKKTRYRRLPQYVRKSSGVISFFD